MALGKFSTNTAMKVMGMKVQADVQQAITVLSSPANAPSTIAKKGSSNPLIDTGHMRQSVSHRLVKSKRKIRKVA